MESHPSIPIRKILRSPSLKRKQRTVPINNRITLERVLGLSVSSNTALAIDHTTGNIAYPAGCVVVIYNPKKGKQTHIFNTSKKTLTCLAFSGDGKYLVTGESGHMPAVRVWDLEEKTQAAEFHGHKFGICCVAFSPNLKYIVSVGTEHDMMANVWNWKSNITVASNKCAAKVMDVAFSEDGSVFVTVGNRHVKFWYLDASKSKIKRETLPLQGRNGILEEHQNNLFTGVAYGKGSLVNHVYVITDSGLLCEFNEKRILVKWVQLRTNCANAISIGEDKIFVGCANGLVRVFHAASLNFITSMPCPHQLGVDLSKTAHAQGTTANSTTVRYPDAIALRYDDANDRLTCVYNDHSLYVWDVTDVTRVGKTRSFLFHSGAIWGIDVYPEVKDSDILPPGTFFTCSSDKTIRIWNCSASPTPQHSAMSVGETPPPPAMRNIYSNELLKILYMDPSDINSLVDKSTANKKDKTDTGFNEKNGVRSVRVRPDGLHLASGDRVGNVRVHDLRTMQQIALVEAHDSEVLCLEYTRPSSGVRLLATASRDRLLHVFDADQSYGLIQTLDDHSSAITAVKFTYLDEQLQMLSCGADKSMLFRNAHKDAEFRFVLSRHLMSRTTLYDMEVDVSGKFVATACQDRNIRIYNTRNGKQKKCYSGSVGNDGTLIGLELDPSGHYVATRCSDKNLSVYDFFTGECVASMFGHSEISTGLKFLNDLKHVVSVSVDGCIFIWRLPLEFTEQIKFGLNALELERIKSELDPTLSTTPISSGNTRRETVVLRGGQVDINADVDVNENFRPVCASEDFHSSDISDDSRPDYRFSVGQLPSWAKRQVLQEAYVKTPAVGGVQQSNQFVPKGRWAMRADEQSVVLKSVLNNSGISDLSMMNNSDLKASLFSSNDSMVDGTPSGVSIINDDDETNKDDDVEDDFRAPSSDLSRVLAAAAHTGGVMAGGVAGVGVGRGHRELSWQSSTSAEDEEADAADAKETVYYMPCNLSESDVASDSSFKVYEGHIGKGSDDAFELSEPSEGDLSQPSSTDPPNDVDLDWSEPASQDVTLSDNFAAFHTTETFDETLKKLEAAVSSRCSAQTVNMEHELGGDVDEILAASEAAFRSHRSSISTRFLTKAQALELEKMAAVGSNSRPSSATQPLSQPLPDVISQKVSSRIGADDSKKKPANEVRFESQPTSTSNKSRDTAVNVRRPGGRSLMESEIKSANNSNTMNKGNNNNNANNEAKRSSMIVTRSHSTRTEEKPSPGRHWKSMLDITGGSGHPSGSKSALTTRASSPVDDPQPRRRSRTPVLSDSSPRTPLSPTAQQRYVTKTEFKLGGGSKPGSQAPSSGTAPSYATLPRTRAGAKPSGRLSTEHPLNTTSAEEKLSQCDSNENLATSVSSVGSHSDRSTKSAKPGRFAYRMATESSTSKMATGASSTNSATVEVRSATGRKSTSNNAKYQSTPNLAVDEENDEENDETGSANSALSAGQPSNIREQRSSLGHELELSEPRQSVECGGTTSNGNVGGADIRGYNGVSERNKAEIDRVLMPPPSANAILASMQQSFIAKAEKYRRSTNPELPPQLSAGMVASRTTNGVQETGRNSSAITRRSLPGTRQDDRSTTNGPSDAQSVASIAASAASVNKRDDAACNGLSKTDNEAASRGAADTNTSQQPSNSAPVSSSPTVVKLGRCVSPIRPYTPREGGADRNLASGTQLRRTLPPDPAMTVAVTTNSSIVDIESPGTASSPLRPRTISANTALRNSSERSSPAAQQVGGWGILEPSDSTPNWVRRAQHVQQQWGNSTSPTPQSQLPQPSEGSPDAESRVITQLGIDRRRTHTEVFKKYTAGLSTGPDSSERLDEGQDQLGSNQADRPVQDMETVAREQWKKATLVKPMVGGASASAAGGRHKIFTPMVGAVGSDTMIALSDVSLVRSSSSYIISPKPAEQQDSLSSSSSMDTLLNWRPSAEPINIAEKEKPFSAPRRLTQPLMQTFTASMNVAETDSSSSRRQSSSVVTKPAEKTLADCERAATDLSHAVNEATDLFNRLQRNGFSAEHSTSEVGLSLLRDTLTEVRAKLDSSLSLPGVLSNSRASLDNAHIAAEMNETVARMLLQYSQDLSTQVVELFKSKLEDLRPHTGP